MDKELQEALFKPIVNKTTVHNPPTSALPGAERLVGVERPATSNVQYKPVSLIKWVNGIPVPYTEWVVDKTKIDSVFLTALSLPYTGREDPITGQTHIEPRFVGLTNIEVAAIRQAERSAEGELESLKFLTDRVLGKAKQQIDTTNVNISLNDFLSSMSEQVAEAEERWNSASSAVTVHFSQLENPL